MRRLSPEERALWGKVAGSVRAINPPGNGEGNHAKHGGGAASSTGKPSIFRSAQPAPSTASRSPSPFRGGISPANTLDGSWDKRLRLGQASPDFTIDQHGETLNSAHSRLNHSLGIAIRHGARMVLLITGRPAKDNPRLPPTSRGVIRASVMDWLAASSHSAHIAAIRGAHPRHGGAGALYVILKRAR